jgi:hypothetical protein
LGAVASAHLDDNAGIICKGAGADFFGFSPSGNKGLGQAGTVAYRFTPTRTQTFTGYRIWCETAPAITASGRLVVWANNGTTQLTKSATDGTTTPIANTISVATTSGYSSVAGTFAANSGTGSVASLTLTAGTTYWVGLFLQGNAAAANYAALYAPSFFGTSLTTANCVFLAGTTTPTALTGAVLDTLAPCIALVT